jgi:hypothetical protein
VTASPKAAAQTTSAAPGKPAGAAKSGKDDDDWETF